MTIRSNKRRRMRQRLGLGLSACLSAVGVAFVSVHAADTDGLSPAEKTCALYEAAVKDAISLQGAEGLRVEFLTDNQAFIDGGCVEQVEICPMTDEEWTLAEALVKLTEREGIPSRFLPFGCS